jgi:hypothetical protein
MTRSGFAQRARRWLAPSTVALLALAATVTSLGHDFTFDDRYVVQTNWRVHELKTIWRLFGQTYWPIEAGGDGYRPVIMSFFTLQWVVGGGAAWLFHLVNILLAVATTLAVYWCAAAVLPRAAAWVAAALFAVHPVHVEVTGNIVGQAELVVALCLCLAVGRYLRGRRTGTLHVRTAAAILGLYALALFTKEHAIVLPGILLAAELTVLSAVPWRTRGREARLFALMIVAVTVAYLFVRSLIQRELTGFTPVSAFRYLRLSAFDRVATMMTEIPRIGRLLVFPTHLSADYSPMDVAVTHGPDVAQLPGLFMCVGVTLLAIALRRRAPVASFGLFWLIIAFLPVSNLLVPAGFIIAERTLFFPSVGVVLVAGAVVAEVVARGRGAERVAAATAVALLTTLGLVRSIDRQRVWKNNDVLTETLVRDQPNGYRAHFLYGRNHAEHYRLREMEREYQRAVRLFPYDAPMMLFIAAEYRRAGFCRPAIALIRWAYAVDSTSKDGRSAYVQCLAKEGQWAEARTEALTALSMVPSKEIHQLRAAVASADSALGRHGTRRAKCDMLPTANCQGIRKFQQPEAKARRGPVL